MMTAVGLRATVDDPMAGRRTMKLKTSILQATDLAGSVADHDAMSTTMIATDTATVTIHPPEIVAKTRTTLFKAQSHPQLIRLPSLATALP